MPFRNVDYMAVAKEMMEGRGKQRSQEEIICDLQREVACLEKEDLIRDVLFTLLNVEHRELEMFDNLMSPMRQMTYLLDVYFATPNKADGKTKTQDRWKEITALLHEIEMSYFLSMAFANQGDIYHDDRDDKVQVSLPTFINHFSNARLSYEEQVLERIERNFTHYDDKIKQAFGFTTCDLIAFMHHMRNSYNKKYSNSALPGIQQYAYYANHPEEWRKLATTLEARGVEPQEWINQPELAGMKMMFQFNPAEVFFQPKSVLMTDKLDRATNEALIKFFTYPQDNKADVPYYTDKSLYLSYPLLELDDDRVVIPLSKFHLEAAWNRIDAWLTKEIGEKYKQYKDVKTEEKVLSIFKRLFGNKAKYYTGYSVDGKCEQDILVEYKNQYLVVEVKNCGFREPMRDPLRGFDKIDRDFSAAIQKGYDQCLRVENALWSESDTTITDGKKFNKVLGTVNRNRIKASYAIVVTEYKYGPIQTNLENLLEKEDGAVYPWSVCVDDLEAFVLLLMKKMPTVAKDRFMEYLEYREPFHERVMCFDELELCGWYVCQGSMFKKFANDDIHVGTFAGMSDVFDAYYYIGLGFDNELDIDVKRQRRLPNYADNFEFNSMSAASLGMAGLKGGISNN